MTRRRKKRTPKVRNRKTRNRSAINRRRARRIAHEKREAKFAGLTHREYVRRRNAREKAYHKRIAGMSKDQIIRDAIVRGKLVGADSLAAYAGLTSEQVSGYEKAAMKRDADEVRRRANLGDKQSQATLRRIQELTRR